MYCRQCGQEIENDSRFCRFCGTSQRFDLSHDMCDQFENMMKDIRERRLLKNGNTIYFVIQGGMREFRRYDHTLRGCNLGDADFIIAAVQEPYTTTGGNRGYDYILLGMYDSQFSEVSSVPVSRDAEIYSIHKGDWYQPYLDIRRTCDLKYITSRHLTSCLPVKSIISDVNEKLATMG